MHTFVNPLLFLFLFLLKERKVDSVDRSRNKERALEMIACLAEFCLYTNMHSFHLLIQLSPSCVHVVRIIVDKLARSTFF